MNHQKGQVLLMTIMLLATVITIVMTVVFRSTTNTQLTKLQEESNKALVAAESGLEKALRENVGTYTFTQLGITNMPGIFLTESTVNVTQELSTGFTSSLVSRDQQYTFYMVSYNNETRTLGTDYYSGSVRFYFQIDSGGSCAGRSLPAIELTLIDNNNGMTKRMIEPCSSGANYITPQTSDFLTVGSGSWSVDGTTYYYRTDPVTISNIKVIIARVLFSGTRIGLQSGSGNLRSQGRNLTAETKAMSGVVKKVELFQSNPQLPAEFFVTNF